jgi:DNA-nicking Smr family endonuclease
MRRGKESPVDKSQKRQGRKPRNRRKDLNDSSVRIPVNGTLDLHMFSPKDAVSVVDEYLCACLEKGIYEVSIIHGKGKGALRRTVHALLSRHPKVLNFKIDSGPSGWGATVVHLKDDRN